MLLVFRLFAVPGSLLAQRTTTISGLFSVALSSSSPSSFYQGVEDWLTDSQIHWVPGSHPDFLLEESDHNRSSIHQHPNSTKTPRSRVLELPVNGRASSNSTITLHLIPTPTSSHDTLAPYYKKDWTNHHYYHHQEEHRPPQSTKINNSTKNKIIHLHQDIWESKRDIVQCRLLANMGRVSQRIFARKTNARKINATYAMEFLESNHLWGATRAKHYYGLFDDHDKDNEELVAVATFSNRRLVHRGGISHRSHELLRFCTRRDVTVVGGISKLLQSFVRDYGPDDIVTVVDRDWGGGAGWHSIGFETVEIMDPNIMVVHPDESGIRRHLVGAGVSHDNPNRGRLGLAPHILERLRQTATSSSAEEALKVLEEYNYFPVYDTGVERLIKLIPVSSSSTTLSPERTAEQGRNATAAWLWETSEPKYASAYYSDNPGISHLLEYAARRSGTKLSYSWQPGRRDATVATVADFERDKVDAYLWPNEREYLESWRLSSTTSTTSSPKPNKKCIFAAPSSLDPTAMVEICDRGNGWRTMGIQGGVTKSIFHSIYKVDPITNYVEPTAVVLEYTKTMLAAFLGAFETNLDREMIRVAHFGLGSGTLMRLMAHELPHSYHVAVELDSGVVAAVQQILPALPSHCQIRQEDALHFGRSSGSEGDNDLELPFDVIFMDVFDEKILHPPDFYSIDYLKHLQQNVLDESGIVVCNLHSGGKRQESCIQEALEAYSKVFQKVFLFDSVDSRPNGGNTILVASPSALLSIESLTRNAVQYQQECNTQLSFDLKARLRSPRLFKN